MAAKKKSTKKKKAGAKKKGGAKKKRAKIGAASARATPKVLAKKRSKASSRGSRATPRVSPHRGSSLDEWAAKKLTGWQADALRIIRALVARHAPSAAAVIKWGQPVWEQNGPFAWARPAATHLSFGFWRGSEISDPEGHLEGDGTQMRHVKIKNAQDLGRIPLDSYVTQAVALNLEKGDPTKRST